MFNQDGSPNKSLYHAIEQIDDWRNFIRSNHDYVRKPRDQFGLGLVDIDSDVWGLVIIGRRHETPRSTNPKRRQLAVSHRVDIHSWDWLVEQAQGRVDALEGQRLRQGRDSS